MPHVSSEVGRLRKVVVQRPGPAHAAMRPEHLEADSPDYLLVEALSSRPARDEVIQTVGRLEPLAAATLIELAAMSPQELALALTTGLVNGRVAMNPLPNLLFTRDLAAVVGDMLIIGNASKRARRRESLLTWTIVEHHPWFAGATVSTQSRKVRDRGGSYPATVEGGDVLVVSPTLAVIGASARTTWSMIVRLAHELCDHHGFTRVLVAEMPKQRSSMHLDTVFTLLDHGHCVVYPPILEQGGPEECSVLRLRASDQGLLVEDVEGNLVEALADEGHPLQVVPCGGGELLHARREQWTDGANFVCLAPGVVVGYARNIHTNQALSEAGFEVLSARAWLDLLEGEFAGDFEALLATGRRFAIGITGSELVRGRGGPRCLTFPILRDV
jgi:arginine deiminase